MKIRQTARHFAARKALETPVVGSYVNDKLVDLHTSVFLDRADEEHREEREEHLDDFFDVTMDTYLTALQEGYTEAQAREITHAQANFDFYSHGWVEMMEFPVDEVEEHYERYRDFFERHGITVEEPLGEFLDGEVAEAPRTPEKLDDPEHPFAEEGYEDDVYVQDEEGEVKKGGKEEPEDVDVTQAPGVGEDAETGKEEGAE
ncbi:MAG: DUF6149 family protein [Halobacteria archaeon]|nr:DUF6149 family protein [Halobacteria archaeon]